jgi:glutamate-ammonia-ligase adenylyltransferase
VQFTLHNKKKISFTACMSFPPQPGAMELPAGLPFRNPDLAKRLLAHLCGTIPPDVYAALLTFLRHTSDLDAALAQFERLAEGAAANLWQLFSQFPALVHYAVVLFGSSQWLGETLIHERELLQQFASHPKRLQYPPSREDLLTRLHSLREQSPDCEFATLLARFKRREYITIALRDFLGVASLSEITAEISCLSDVLIEAGLHEAQSQAAFPPSRETDSAEHSRPRFAVISLGKLGGNELNYSSDVDLMFLYDSGLPTAIAEGFDREYAIALAQRTTELLSRHTTEGAVFRIDLRLRPQGSQEELAISLPHAVRYYQQVAQDWELQALIKARHCAGDALLSREFTRAVQPQVYRPELNFTAIKTALRSRERIDKRRTPRSRLADGGNGIDVKLDRGGIRDIEFLVQCLQRTYGGAEPWLRSSGTLFALQKLHDKDHLSGPDFQTLNETYVFLRTIEHRLQLRHGRQTHRLPEGSGELELVARSMQRNGSGGIPAAQFLAQVHTRMSEVSEIYRRIIFHRELEEEATAVTAAASTEQRQCSAKSERALQRISSEIPELAEALHAARLSPHGERNLERFLSSAARASAGSLEFLQRPHFVSRACRLFEASDFLSDALVRNPADVSLLAGEELAGDFDIRCGADLKPAPRSADDAGDRLATLRSSFRQRMLVSAARDVLLPRDIYTSLAEKSDIADGVIKAALEYGKGSADFAVMALGRLGSREFDVLSDADLVFVSGETASRERAQQTAERLVQALTLYTREGSVFAVDTRLRPRGYAGELVLTPAQLAVYFSTEAKPWEALTYLRLRYVAGDASLAQAAVEAVQESLRDRMSARTGFDEELMQIRDKLENSDPNPNLKTGAGGVYDTDYVVGALQVRHSCFLAANFHDRIALVRDRGLLDFSDADVLQENARFLRSFEHAVRLATSKAAKWIPASEHARRQVQELMSGVLQPGESIEMRLRSALVTNREIYRKILRA